VTPEDMAADMAADPIWRFNSDPVNVVAHCSTRAAEHAVNGRRTQALWWASVGAELVRLADNPYIRVGAVMGGILGGL